MLHRSVARLACGLRSTSLALARPSAPKRFVPTTISYQSHTSGSASLLLQKWRFVAATAVSTSASYAFCSTAASVTDTVNTNRAVPKVVLYQYEPCPYCCKVKAVLDYLKLPYDVVEVNPLTKKETKAVTKYAKVPVVTIGNDMVVESAAIIARLWDLVVPAKSSQLEHKEPQEEEAQWCQWALQAFDFCLTAGNFTSMELHLSKYVGAMVMYLIAKRLKKKYGIDDKRLALYAALNSWVDAVGDKRPFLGGHEPNKADLSVFGVLRAMHGLDTYNDVMRETKIWPWFRCMTDRFGSSSCTASKQLEITVKE
uniref:GST N-terminal domain-containing protein n=1 Tax=Peronospora matthiolae TaxID=2874970 RepID=A0AAV1UE53_9STRA